MAKISSQYVRKRQRYGKNTLTKTNAKQNWWGEPTHLKKKRVTNWTETPPRGEKQIA